jgi:hypothetical protein
MSDFIVKDSGRREEFPTGSRRDTNEGKPRPDLISPYFLERLGLHMQKGLAKYGEHNWAKGQPTARYMESAFRHLVQLFKGDRDEDHAAAVAFNVMGIIHNEECIKKDLLPADLGNLSQPWIKSRTEFKLDLPPRSEKLDKIMEEGRKGQLPPYPKNPEDHALWLKGCLSVATDEGAKAANSLTSVECPYPKGSPLSKAWWNGYHTQKAVLEKKV